MKSARAFAADKAAEGKKVEIEKRPGRNGRCELPCRVLRWCEQAKALGVKQPEDDDGNVSVPVEE